MNIRRNHLRQRLGWRPGIINRESGKPKGMHWRTFQRLTAVHDACAEVSLAGLARWLEAMKKRQHGVRDAPEGWC